MKLRERITSLIGHEIVVNAPEEVFQANENEEQSGAVSYTHLTLPTNREV